MDTVTPASQETIFKKFTPFVTIYVLTYGFSTPEKPDFDHYKPGWFSNPTTFSCTVNEWLTQFLENVKAGNRIRGDNTNVYMDGFYVPGTSSMEDVFLSGQVNDDVLTFYVVLVHRNHLPYNPLLINPTLLPANGYDTTGICLRGSAYLMQLRVCDILDRLPRNVHIKTFRPLCLPLKAMEDFNAGIYTIHRQVPIVFLQASTDGIFHADFSYKHY